MQQYIWKEIATMSEVVVNLSVDEFMRVAVDGGIDSVQCEVAAASIMTLSSIHVRARVVMRLRQVSTVYPRCLLLLIVSTTGPSHGDFT